MFLKSNERSEVKKISKFSGEISKLASPPRKLRFINLPAAPLSLVLKSMKATSDLKE